MFGLLKQVVLCIYFWLVRLSKRERLLKTLIPRYKKREIDIPELPAVFDEIRLLPESWQDDISFVGFNNEGLCIIVAAHRQSRGCITIHLGLDIPGYGKYKYKEIGKNTSERDKKTQPCIEGRRIHIYCLDPMKRWKVVFRGPLNDMNVNGKQIHATVLLYWQCLFDPYDHHLSPSCWKLAGSFCNISLQDIRALSIFDRGACYEQWGELRGRINIETQDEQYVRLKSVRERNFSLRNSNANDVRTCFRQHFLLKESGLSFSQRIMRFCNKTWVYSGYIAYPIKDMFPTTIRNLKKVCRNDEAAIFSFPQHIMACNICYIICEKLSRHCYEDQNSNVNYKTLTINKRVAFGVNFSSTEKRLDNNENQHEREYLVDVQPDVSLKGCDPEVVSLDDRVCKAEYLVGGKACKLSAVISLGKFNVPKGFCITTKAYSRHIKEGKALKEAIKGIEECVKKLKVSDLKKKCDDAAKVFKQTSLNEDLQVLIREHLEDVFGKDDWKSLKFAIRSSGISEDSIETSAAGEMDTYLGIQGLENIISAVQRCWASSCSYQCVEYRRQNGQELIENMGVIVQEMVNAHISGIVFTVDPVTGSESNLVINASTGLGESIASGEINPDTIIVNRENEGNLQIVTVQTSNTEKRPAADDGIETQRKIITVSDISKACIQKEDIFRICETAVQLEKSFRTSQDIEWAIYKGKLHILQARPITGLDLDAYEDLLHEFDSPIVGERELITTSNVQEMMPGAVSTLTGDLFISAVDRACNYAFDSRLGIKQPIHALTFCLTMTGLGFLNITSGATNSIYGIGGDESKCDFEIYFCGQSVEKHDINVIKEFFGREYSLWQRTMKLFREYILLKNRDSKLFDNLKAKSETFVIAENVETAAVLYERINDNLFFYYEMWRAYIFKATESIMWSGIIMAMLKGNTKEMSVKSLADLALILSECTNVISAQVPKAIKNLARRIAESGFKEEFLSIPAEECASFLQNCSDDKLQSDYSVFMEQHGHRGIREAEFSEKSWAQDPCDLMETIQLIVRQGVIYETERESKTIDEIVNGLQTELTRLQKFILRRYLVQAAMDGVGSREIGKSYIIKVTDIFKRAYWRLADMMVSESRLPEQMLLFFLTHREIGELLQHRSAKLVRLARRRKRVLPEMNQIKYPEINFGLPKPIKEQNLNKEISSFLSLQGMPVCRGKAEGRACVVKVFQDANQLVEGNILICKCTDVGWSPYFPLISGLVTELGGLLSHGAVIARECGIPCIISIPGATDLIKTGDSVVLDGTAGTIKKIQ